MINSRATRNILFRIAVYKCSTALCLFTAWLPHVVLWSMRILISITSKYFRVLPVLRDCIMYRYLDGNWKKIIQSGHRNSREFSPLVYRDFEVDSPLDHRLAIAGIRPAFSMVKFPNDFTIRHTKCMTHVVAKQIDPLNSLVYNESLSPF